MKRFSILFCVFFLLSNYIKAQDNLDCSGATFVCGSSTISGNNIGFGEDDFASPNNDSGCLLTQERYSNWFIFEAATSGSVTFVIKPSTPSDDYDFAVFDSDRTCDDLGSPIRCNYSGLTGNTGLSITGASPTFEAQLLVTAGETYYLLVDNFSQSGSGFSLSWNGTATLVAIRDAEISLSTNCNVVEFSNQTRNCLSEATYLWDFGDGNTSTEENPIHTYTDLGTYTVSFTIFGEDESSSTTQSVEITSIRSTDEVEIVDLDNELCLNSPPINLSTKGSPTGGTFSIDGMDITELNTEELGEGTYTLVYTFTSPTGCVESTTQEIIVNPLPALNFVDLESEYCVNVEDVTLEANPSGGFFTVNSSPETSLNLSDLGVGTHTVSYTYTDGNNCTATIEKTILINPLPVLSFVNFAEVYCYNAPKIVLTSYDIVEPDGGTFFIDGEVRTELNPGLSSSEIQPGEHILSYQFLDANNCSQVISQSFTVLPPQNLSIPNLSSNYCIENSAFDLNPSPNNGTLKINGLIKSDRTFDPSEIGLGEHIVEYISNTKCDTLIKVVNIRLPPNPIPLQENLSVCTFSGDSLTIDLGEDYDDYSVLWEAPLAGFPKNTRQILVGQIGTYTVTATDSLNCSVTRNFVVIEDCSPVFAVPNAFSPNGDGLNDVFEVLGQDIHFFKYELVIFSRWGEIVFKGNLKGDSWNGNLRGKPAPEGTYICIIKYQELPNGPEKKIRSKLTLVR